MKPFFLIPLPLLLTSCAELPSEKAAELSSIKTPAKFQASQGQGIELEKSLASVFPDPTLQSYVQLALKKSPTLQLALYQVEEAGFSTKKAESGLGPRLDGNASAARSINPASRSGLNAASSLSASFDASWEWDVWGRIESTIDAASRLEQARVADFHAAKQSLIAQTVQAYFSYIAAKQSETLAQSRVRSLSQTLELVNKRFERGTSALEDLELARSDLETAKANLANRQNASQVASRTLTVLTGSYPNTAAKAFNWPKLNRSVPAGLPSSLMMNRPDIQAAFLRIKAADASVKVAHRDLYPRFNLTSSLGKSSTVLQDLLEGKATVWSLAGGVSGPILDAGNREAELGAANARAKQALASYQASLLSAFEEVENALGAEQFLKRQQSAQSASVEAAKKAEQRILQSFEKGLSGILNVLVIQRRRFDAEDRLISTTNQRYQNRVALALALGKAY